jgi:hypothetical protein
VGYVSGSILMWCEKSGTGQSYTHSAMQGISYYGGLFTTAYSSDGPSTVSVHLLTSSHFPIKQSLSSREICKNMTENI